MKLLREASDNERANLRNIYAEWSVRTEISDMENNNASVPYYHDEEFLDTTLNGKYGIGTVDEPPIFKNLKV